MSKSSYFESPLAGPLPPSKMGPAYSPCCPFWPLLPFRFLPFGPFWPFWPFWPLRQNLAILCFFHGTLCFFVLLFLSSCISRLRQILHVEVMDALIHDDCSDTVQREQLRSLTGSSKLSSTVACHVPVVLAVCVKKYNI